MFPQFCVSIILCCVSKILCCVSRIVCSVCRYIWATVRGFIFLLTPGDGPCAFFRVLCNIAHSVYSYIEVSVNGI